ncbi:MAG: hypothetical protein RR436_01675 [Clostridia bacterium]
MTMKGEFRMDNRYMLNICGTNIGVISNETEQDVMNLAKKAEDLIMDVKKSCEFANLEMSAIVAIMTLLEEFNEMKKSVEDNRNTQRSDLFEIEKYKNLYEQTKVEVETLRRELDLLRSNKRIIK